MLLHKATNIIIGIKYFDDCNHCTGSSIISSLNSNAFRSPRLSPLKITLHRVESNTPPVIEGEYIIIVRIVLGIFVNCAKDHAMKNDRMNPPTPTKTEYISVFGKTYCIKTESFVNKLI